MQLDNNSIPKKKESIYIKFSFLRLLLHWDVGGGMALRHVDILQVISLAGKFPGQIQFKTKTRGPIVL